MFICGQLIPARVAQLIERWSYKPEVEGLSPSSGTKLYSQSSRLTGRDSSRQNGDCLGAWSSQRRVGLTPRPHVRTTCGSGWLNFESPHSRSSQFNRPLPQAVLTHPCVSRACSSAEPERLSSKQNVAGSSPARPASSLRSSSSWKERSSHKREVAGSNPASATNSSGL